MSGVEELITEHIDVWTSAIKRKSSAGRGGSKKIELYGVKKLRALILDFAVRGLLVPQNPSDEPASVLFDQISDEKADLVKKKIIKEKKNTSPPDGIEVPFTLPAGWGWGKLGSIGVVTSSSRVHQKDWTERGVPFYRAREIVKLSKNESIQNALFISKEKFKELSQNGSAPSPMDIMITGVGTIGIPYVVKQRDHFYFKDASVLIFRNYHKLNPDYLSKVMMSPYWIKKVHEGSMGTTVHTLTIQRANTVEIPIAPIEEQHRIVAKVDELMALCDQLELQTESSITAHQTLVETLLGALTQSTSTSPSSTAQLDSNQATPQDTFEQAWERIAEHFDTLFTTEQSIELLKQSILQLAVMGKLVPQDPNDEPASELLKRIAVEKAELVEAKVIKKQKALPEIGEDEKPFELPVGWEWSRISSMSLVGTGATPSRDNSTYFSPQEFAWVTSGETSQEFITETKELVSKKATLETNVTIYPPGTLIVAMYGQGKTRGQVTELKIAAGTNQACAAIQLIEMSESHRAFIKMFFRKSYDELRSHAAGGAQPNLNVGKIALTVVPVPPLQEQNRIVSKVVEIMAVCDQLNARLADSKKTQLQLADTITEQATS